MQKTAKPIDGWFGPMLAYWSSLGLVSLIMFFSWNFSLGKPLGLLWYIKGLNLFLTGAPSTISPDRIPIVQTDTLSVACISFEIAYVIIITRMLVRLKVNEYSSLENLRDVNHLIAAIVTSTVVTVVLSKNNAPIPLSYFFAIGAGIRPDFYILSLAAGADAAIRAQGSPFAGSGGPGKSKPVLGDITPEIPLDLIEGLSEEVVGRLRGIGITTTHRLAFSNPLVVWGRLPSTISEVVDWIGQAMLLVQCLDNAMKLRRVQIRTIQELVECVRKDSKVISNILQINDAEMAAAAATIEMKDEVKQIIELQRTLPTLGKKVGVQANLSGGRTEAAPEANDSRKSDS